ncbi:TrmB family transcriptional regulator (plasmid) [Halococcus dombrowskii]|uniref:TrmB family transcriptional regulator n=1 Tax=Halococcus dombrowskii TaxID=179637 RepID=A0AAV3SHR8_HALDO|nr:TrmB family transcriptional regulator sugar-binding domain-containing protein [Halococcus dombrowskii]UOO97270.1 TrmB family transcriptional regulator [Halococcus dombrowskii]
MNEDDIIDRLTRFGLSDKEALAYLSILRNGNTQISVVSEEADLSKSYTYDVVDKLEAKNLIEIDDHIVPTQIRALPPSQGIENLVSQLSTIEAELESIFDTENYEQETFSIIKARQTILGKLNDLIGSAESEIVLSLPASALEAVEESLRSACGRETFCMLLITEYGDEFSVDDSLATIVQSWDAPAPVMLTTDRSDGVVASADAVLDSNSNEYAIYHAETHIVSALFDSFIANHWQMGTQEYVADAGTLPKAYDSFRHAIFDVALHRAQDRAIEAELSVRPPQTTDPFETITEPVVDVKQSLVRPYSNDLPTQESLVLGSDDHQFEVGGPRTFLEDYEATDVTLHPAGES